jgi:hypothetical protein
MRREAKANREASAKPVLGGHQTFTLRYGWLKKLYDYLCEDQELFQAEDAMVRLGVGKNMVASMRFWGVAMQMIEPQARGRRYQPTDLAHRLLRDDGWDPYLEDTGTLWLLHGLLATNATNAYAWHMLFNHYRGAEVNVAQLAEFLGQQLRLQGWNIPAATLEREAECCLRTYRPPKSGGARPSEDALASPLSALQLIDALHDERRFLLERRERPSLPPAILGHFLIHFWQAHAPNRATLSIEECLYQPNSPGQVFKLRETALLNLLEQLERQTDGALSVDETAGIQQVYRRAPIEPMKLLQAHYEGSEGE